jgi:hypothetical protein
MIVMEGTETAVLASARLQRHMLTDKAHEIRRISYAFDI